MILGKDPPQPGPSRSALGADAGASLVKLVLRRGDRPPEYRLVPRDALEQVAEQVEAADCERVGVTGGGAAELVQRLRAIGNAVTAVDEFEAWRAGAAALLAETGGEIPDRYLLVSLGTGCSALLVEGDSVTRLGGTALGGGTILGLGRALLGAGGAAGETAGSGRAPDFSRLAALAREGDRRHVDLLVSDIYGAGESPLPGDIVAASFAKLARGGDARPRDLAHALMGLVGENVGLIVGGLAAAADVRLVVYGGTCLRDNEALVQVLHLVTAALGREAVFLRNGEFTGALGALCLAATG